MFVEFLQYKISVFYLLYILYFLKRSSYASPHSRGRELHLASLIESICINYLEIFFSQQEEICLFPRTDKRRFVYFVSFIYLFNYIFISIQGHGCLFYTLDYDPILHSLTTLSPLQPLRTYLVGACVSLTFSHCWIFTPSPPPLVLSCFLALQNDPSLFFIFPALSQIQLFPQGTVVLLIGKWYLKPKSSCFFFYRSPQLTEQEKIYIYRYRYIDIYGYIDIDVSCIYRCYKYFFM